MVGFADEVRKLTKPKPRLPEWLLTLTPEDRAAFDEAVLGELEPEWEPLVALVRKHGASTTRDTLKRYRAERVSRR